MNGLTKGQVVFAILLVAAATFFALAHVFSTGFACGWEGSSCAESSEKNGVYEGFLRAADGEPYRSSVFTVEFGSREGDEEVPFRTDEDGRYCIRWAEEDFATVRSPSGESISIQESDSFLGSWRDLDGSDPPSDCQESYEGIPWNAARDAETTWQYWLLMVLPIAAIAVLLTALIGQRSRYGLALLTAGGLLFAVDLFLFFVLGDS